jgi:sugar phosphate permease
MMIYGLQYSDKTSLSSGVVFGLIPDTGITGNQFGDLSSFFYMAYGIAQLPMGYMLQRFPICRALSVCVILWGSMVLLLAACHNYAQLAAVRTLLGWFESVVTPGFALLPRRGTCARSRRSVRAFTSP